MAKPPKPLQATLSGVSTLNFFEANVDPMVPQPKINSRTPSALQGNSLLVFSPTNRLRKLLYFTLKHRGFAIFMNIVLILTFVVFAIFPTHWGAYPTMLPLPQTNLPHNSVEPIPSFPLPSLIPGNILSTTLDFSKMNCNDTSSSQTCAQEAQFIIFQFYNNIKHSILIACFSVFTFHIIATIIVNGLLFGDNAFLRSDVGRYFDVLTVSCFWVEIGLWVNGINDLRIFYAFSTLYCLHLMELTNGTQNIVWALKKALPLLLSVLFLMFFFMILFSLIGVRVFEGSLSRQCSLDFSADGVSGTMAALTVAPSYVIYGCGQYITSPTDPTETIGAIVPSNYPTYGTVTTTTGNVTLSHYRPKGYACQYGQLCEYLLPPYNGFRSYDDILSALVITIDTTATSGWTHLMYLLKQAEYSWLVPFYFILLVVFIAFILSSLFVAVLTESFLQARLFTGKNVMQEETSNFVMDLGDDWGFDDTAADIEPLWRKKIRQSYKYIRLAFLFANIITQAFRTAGSRTTVLGTYTFSGTTQNFTQADLLDWIELGFTIAFAIEVLVKLVILRTRFFLSKRNIFDAFLALVTCIIQIPGIKCWRGSLLCTWDEVRVYRFLTVFQLLRFYRAPAELSFVKEIVVNLRRSAKALRYVFLFFVIVIFVLSIFCMHFFGGQFENAQPNLYGYGGSGDGSFGIFLQYYWLQNNGYPPRHNFDTFWSSFLNIFRIQTADNWEDIMYDSMQAQWYSGKENDPTEPDPYPGYHVIGAMVSGIVFCSWWMFSNYVINNLVIATILDNFELSDEEKIRHQYDRYIAEVQKEDHSLKLTNTRVIHILQKALGYGQSENIKIKNLPPKFSADIQRRDLENMVQQLITTEQQTTEALNKQKLASEDRPFWTGILNFFNKSQTDPNMLELTSLTGETVSELKLQESEDFISHPRKSLYQADTVKEFFETDMSALEHFIKTTTKNLDSEDMTGHAKRKQENLEKEETLPPYDKSFAFMARSHPVRRFARWIVGADQRDKRDRQSLFSDERTSKPMWDYFMITVILVSTGFLAADAPVLSQPANSPYREFFRLSDLGFLGIFAADFILRLIADGIYLTPNAYFRNPWNIFDFVLLILLAIDAGYYRTRTDPQGIARAFRALRGLRPLRLINQFDGIKRIFTIILVGVDKLFQALSMSLLVLVPYAIWGVNLWAGVFFNCNDNSVLTSDECVGEFQNSFFTPNPNAQLTYLVPRSWDNPVYCDFDDLPHAMLCIYEDISTEGWTAQLWNAEDVFGFGYQPMFAQNIYMAPFYFIPWMLIGWVVMSKMFSAIVVGNFKKQTGMNLLTDSQRRWKHLLQQLKTLAPMKSPMRPTPPEVDGHAILTLPQIFILFRIQVYDIIVDKRGRFARFITIVMFTHMAVYCTEFFKESIFDTTKTWLLKTQGMLNLIFILVYLVEMIMRMIAFGPIQYFKSFSNLYDFVVITAALLTGVYQEVKRFENQINYSVEQAGKVLVLLIILRLVNKVDKLDTMFKTLKASFWDIVNISLFCVLVLVSFAIMSMQIFGLTRNKSNTSPMANFHDYFFSTEMMFRMSTGESWNYVMHDLAIDTPDKCILSATNLYQTDCGSPAWSYVIFISFYTFGTFLCIDLFLAVILNNFSYWSQGEANSGRIDRNSLRDFKESWRKYDPESKGFIQVHDIPKFLVSLRGKFSVRIYEPLTFSKLLTDPLFRKRCFDFYQPKNIEPKLLQKYTHPTRMRFNSAKTAILMGHWRKIRAMSRLRAVFVSDLEFIRQNKNDPGNNTRRSFNEKKEALRQLSLTKTLNSCFQSYDSKETLRKRRDEFNAIYLETLNGSENNHVSFEVMLMRILSYRLVAGDKQLSFKERETRRIIRDRVNEFMKLERAAGFLYNLNLKRILRSRNITIGQTPQSPQVDEEEDFAARREDIETTSLRRKPARYNAISSEKRNNQRLLTDASVQAAEVLVWDDIISSVS